MTTECKQLIASYEEFEDMPMFNGPNANFNLLSGILKHGFEKPSDIQKKIITPIFQGRNVIAQSQSGTGKTGSFVIGSLGRLDPTLDHVQLIIMAHTHELAEQTYSVIQSLGSSLINTSKVELCVGKRISVDDNIVHIKKGSQVLIGTPGRIHDLVFRTIDKKGQMLINPKHVKTVILDEADCLLSKKFYDSIVDIVEKLENPQLRNRNDMLQICIFSATLPDEDKDALDRARLLCVPNMNELGDNWRSDPKAPLEILIPVQELSLSGIEQFYYKFECNDPRDMFRSKVDLILALHEESVIAQCIIYVNNQDTAIRLQAELNHQELNSQCIYGRMMPKERISIINRFRKCETRILISTDLLARGFDVQQVSMVINFDLPYVTDRNTGDIDQDKMAEYLHRIGRSGRFGRKGIALNLVATSSEMSRLKTIEDHYETLIKELPDDISILSS